MWLGTVTVVGGGARPPNILAVLSLFLIPVRTLSSRPGPRPPLSTHPSPTRGRQFIRRFKTALPFQLPRQRGNCRSSHVSRDAAKSQLAPMPRDPLQPSGGQ